jgi:hypothetical protein
VGLFAVWDIAAYLFGGVIERTRMNDLAAQQLGEAQLHLVVGKELLRLSRVAKVVQVGIAVQDKLGRLHKELSRRLTGVQRDQFQLSELLEIKIDVHSTNASVGCTTCQSNYGNHLNFGWLP